jgi:hypothetical protein
MRKLKFTGTRIVVILSDLLFLVRQKWDITWVVLKRRDRHEKEGQASIYSGIEVYDLEGYLQF